MVTKKMCKICHKCRWVPLFLDLKATPFNVPFLISIQITSRGRLYAVSSLDLLLQAVIALALGAKR